MVAARGRALGLRVAHDDELAHARSLPESPRVHWPRRSVTPQMHQLSYFHAIVIGLLQGVTELFPVSSLGHGVILPALFGWNDLVDAAVAARELLPRLPRRPARRHGGRAASSSTGATGCGSSRAFFATLRTGARDARRAVRLAHHLRDDPCRHRRPALRAPASRPVREAARRLDLPHDQRPAPPRRRARPAPDPRVRGDGSRAEGRDGRARRGRRRRGRRVSAPRHAVVPEGHGDRLDPDPRALRRHQPLGGDHGRWHRATGSTTRMPHGSASCSRPP